MYNKTRNHKVQFSSEVYTHQLY